MCVLLAQAVCHVTLTVCVFKRQNLPLKGLILIIQYRSYVIPAPGSAVIWLVINTATLYSERKQTGGRRQPHRRGYQHSVTAFVWRDSAHADTFGDLLQPGEHLGQLLLPLSQFTPTGEVHSEQSHDGVNDLTTGDGEHQTAAPARLLHHAESLKAAFTHQQLEHSSFLVKFCCYKVQQLHLMLT